MALWLRLALYAALLSFVYCWASSQLIIAPKRLVFSYTPSELGLKYEDVSFTTRDGIDLKGWFVPAENPKGAVALCHGYGLERGDCLGWVRFLHGGGYGTLLFDFRGHGESGGRYCSLGYYEVEDLKAALEYLSSRGEEKLAAMGFSMGGTVALMVGAGDERLRAIVTDGAYLSFHSVVASFAKKYYHAPKYPFIPPAIWAAGLRLRFNPRQVDLRKYAGSVSPRPILLIHGEEDREVPLGDAEAIYRAAKEPKELWVVPGAEHSSTYGVAREKYEEKVITFLDQAMGEE